VKTEEATVLESKPTNNKIVKSHTQTRTNNIKHNVHNGPKIKMANQLTDTVNG